MSGRGSMTPEVLRFRVRRFARTQLRAFSELVGWPRPKLGPSLHLHDDPAEPAHPSTLCRCFETPPLDNASAVPGDQLPGCEWVRAMCRACAGTGWCKRCGGDGCDPGGDEAGAMEQVHAELAAMRDEIDLRGSKENEKP